MYTISKLAKDFSLSRSTLLYYDSIGLLVPSIRSATNYRLYSDEDRKRLEQICIYRQVGLSLKEIENILDTPESSTALILEKRLAELNQEISSLREQQHIIVILLGNQAIQGRTTVINEEDWVALFRSIGLDDTDMHRWHQEFERLSPEKHQSFLESLGISAGDIAEIRRKARTDINHN